MTLTPSNPFELEPEEIRKVTYKLGGADTFEYAVKLGAKAQYEKLAAVPEEQMVEMVASKVYACGEPRDEPEYKLLPNKQKEQYKEVAQDILSQLSTHFNARQQEAVEKAIKEDRHDIGIILTDIINESKTPEAKVKAIELAISGLLQGGKVNER